MKRLLAFAVMVLLVPRPCSAAQPPEDEELKKLQEELTKLQEEKKRLDELTKLKTEIARMKEENKRLKDQLDGVKPPPPPQPKPVKPTLPIPRDRWDLAPITSTLPLKVASVALHDTNDVAITLEFVRDLEPRDILSLNQIMRAERSFLSFWFMDRDKVAIHTEQRFLIEGVISGKKGEAFRLLLRLPEDEIVKRVNRVEVRGGG